MKNEKQFAKNAECPLNAPIVYRNRDCYMGMLLNYSRRC